MTPREAAELEAKETYVRFLGWMKKGTWVILAGLLAVASCNFGVDGTGGGYEPNNAKEYQQRMIEMGKQFKDKH
tara:strand:+ start:452 stop:673 length:222 start_codon:yes stop_codon:yes gene_type:complete